MIQQLSANFLYIVVISLISQEEILISASQIDFFMTNDNLKGDFSNLMYGIIGMLFVYQLGLLLNVFPTSFYMCCYTGD